MKCQVCQNEVGANMKFCTHCGATVVRTKEPETKENICKNCGAAVSLQAAFCKACGQPLHSETVSPTAVSVSAPVTPKSVTPSVRTEKKKGGGKKTLLYILITLLIAALAGLSVYFIMKNKNDTAPQNTSGDGTSATAEKENELTLKVHEAPDITNEETYTISGGAYSVSEDAKISINGKIVTKVTAGGNDTMWEEEVKLEKGENTFEVIIYDESGHSKKETVIITYEPEENEDEYLFPSDTKYITAADLKGKTASEVALIRNEIYARHGYIFSNQIYIDYFSEKAWYVPNANFSEAMFNEIELANKTFLVEYEESKGWR